MDRTMRLELEWVDHGADEQLALSIHNKILGCLPSSIRNSTMAQSVIKLQSLLDSDMGQFSSLRSQ
eukprot:14990685-Heterocapsa_arctica.AAC.1